MLPASQSMMYGKVDERGKAFFLAAEAPPVVIAKRCCR